VAVSAGVARSTVIGGRAMVLIKAMAVGVGLGVSAHQSFVLTSADKI